MIEIKSNEFKELISYVKNHYGINLSQKKNLIEGRLSNVLLEKGFDNFSDYLQYVFADHTNLEITNLINKITTNHTFFMREIDHFIYLEKKVLPYLQATNKEKDIRIWSAGCSSGEEPYTLAMIIADYFGNEKMLWDTKILATDISVKVLETAEQGIYPQEMLESLPKIWKNKYFRKKTGEYYEISTSIKQEIVFRIFNLMDRPFSF